MSLEKKAGRRFFDYDFQIAGQRYRGSTGCVSRREAEKFEQQKREEARAALAAGRVDPERMTISDVFARYWADHLHKLPSAYTYEFVTAFIPKVVGPDKLYAEVRNDDVLKFIKARREYGKRVKRHVGGERVRVVDAQGRRQFKRVGGKLEWVRVGEVSDATIIGAVAIWKAAHNMARDVWEIPVRPIAWSKLRPDAPEKRNVDVEYEDAQDLIAKLPRHIMLASAFTLVTACRLKQMAGVEVRHVDFTANTVTVRKQKRKSKNGAWVPEVKQMNALAVQCVHMALADRGSIAPDTPVFDLTNFRREWNRARELTKLHGFRFHDLRHVIATWLVRNGVPLPVVQEALGHSSLMVTQRYIDVNGTDVAKALSTVPTLQLPGMADAKSDAEIPGKSPALTARTRKKLGNTGG